MEKTSMQKYLESLKGKKCKIYRNGPESNSGKIIDVNPEYLIMQSENNEIIYYNTNHIKTMCEDSASRFNLEDDTSSNIQTEYVYANSFNQLADQLKGQMVQINRGGPNSRQGMLLDVKQDYISISTEKEGIIYYKNQHIKSMSGVNQNTTQEEENNELTSLTTQQNFEPSIILVAGETFNELLKNLQFSWVKINRSGPESIEGLLVEIYEDHLIMTQKQEVIRVPIYHINNISLVVQEKKANENEQQQLEAKNKENNNNNAEEKENNTKLDASKAENNKNENKENKNNKNESKNQKDNKNKNKNKIESKDDKKSNKKANNSKTEQTKTTKAHVFISKYK